MFGFHKIDKDELIWHALFVQDTKNELSACGVMPVNFENHCCYKTEGEEGLTSASRSVYRQSIYRKVRRQQSEFGNGMHRLSKKLWAINQPDACVKPGMVLVLVPLSAAMDGAIDRHKIAILNAWRFTLDSSKCIPYFLRTGKML